MDRDSGGARLVLGEGLLSRIRYGPLQSSEIRKQLTCLITSIVPDGKGDKAVWEGLMGICELG